MKLSLARIGLLTLFGMLLFLTQSTGAQTGTPGLHKPACGVELSAGI